MQRENKRINRWWKDQKITEKKISIITIQCSKIDGFLSNITFVMDPVSRNDFNVPCWVLVVAKMLWYRLRCLDKDLVLWLWSGVIVVPQILSLPAGLAAWQTYLTMPWTLSVLKYFQTHDFWFLVVLTVVDVLVDFTSWVPEDLDCDCTSESDRDIGVEGELSEQRGRFFGAILSLQNLVEWRIHKCKL